MWEEFASNKSKPNLFSGAKKPASVGLVQVTGIFSGATSVKQEEGPVTPVVKYTLTINPTPSDAKVTINGVVGNSYTGREGITANWKVEAEGYETKTGELTLVQDETISVSLEVKKYTFTINPTPANAKVVINGTEGSSFVLEHGILVSWSVSSENYITKTGELTLTQDTTISVALEAIRHTFTINPTPANAKVIINGIERKSITAIQGSEIVWSVSAENYTEKSGTLTLTQTEVLDVELEAIMHTFTINATPDDAVVVINGTERKSLTAIQGSEIVWSVSATGYTSQNGSFVLTESKELEVDLSILRFTFAINPTPSDARVIINETETKSVTVDYGTNVSWSVSSEGYVEQSGEQIVTKNTTLPINLSLKQFTFTINPTPSDALVTINGQTTNSLTVNYGTEIEWTVSATGYTAQSGDLILTEHTTLDIVLQALQATLTIVPTPSDAIVTINGQVGNSYTANLGTSVTWQVSASGYGTQNGNLVLDSDKTIEVVLEASGVKSIEAVGGVVWVLKTNGDLYGCGNNGYGQQGNGTTEDVLTFTKVASNVSSVCPSEYTTGYINTNGDFYLCGRSDNGQQGVSTTTKKTIFSKKASNVTKIDTGLGNMTGYLDESGSLYLCGVGGRGQQGSGLADVKSFTQRATDVKDFDIYNTSSAYINNNNEFYLCGNNNYGQQGMGYLPTTNSYKEVSKFTKRADNVIKALVNEYNTFYLTSSGELYGAGSKTTLGDYSAHQPSFVKVAENVKYFTSVYADLFYIDENNALYGRGSNTGGQQGSGTSDKVTTFVKKAENVKKVIVTIYTAGYLTFDGEFYLCGQNTQGQQGNGTTDAVLSFTKRAENVKDFSLSSSTSFYVTNDDEVYGCGNNNRGQQGNGTTENVLTFTKVNV